MTIEQRIAHLKEYVNQDEWFMSAILMRNDFVIRDVYPYEEKPDAHYANVMLTTPWGHHVNHGWGKLKPLDKQIHDIQIRYLYRNDNPPYEGRTFSYYLSKQQ